MKWLLVLSLALVARGGLLQVDPPIDDDVVTDLPTPIIDTDGEPIPKPEPEPEPEISEIIYEEIPEPPEEGGHDNDTDGTVLSRNKRFITTGTYLWPNNHVMYSYKTGQFPSEASKSSTQFSIGYLKDRTCVSFTEVDDAAYKSPHVKFVVGSGCYANLGYNPYGYSKCSCCSKGTCYHEMLHLLGFMHEHQRSDRDRYIEVDWLKISQDKWTQFKKLKESSINHIDGHIYKVGSTMHYSGWAFQQELFGASIKTVNDDYNMAEDFYYPIREVNLRYKCKEADCSNFTKTCVNDGYVTKYMDQCKCVCPDGLSPNDGCSKAVTTPNAVDWPRGSYAFVAAGTGCPIGFDIGYRKHYSRGYSWSIFGTWKNPMKGVQDHASTEYEFCVSKNNFPTSGNKWPAGVYCLHRVGGTCPEGFHSGSVQLDDYIKDQYHNNTKAGVLPDGVFDQDTKFEFCCRNDGLMTIPIEVPLTNEFVLYQAEYKTTCQEVKDFDSYTFDFTFDNYNSASGTIAASSGRAPYYHRYSGDRVYFWFNACHYTPLDLSCGATIDLDSANPSQTFSTSNYPNNYSPLQKCNFLITAPEGSQIYLDFNTFDVHSTDSVQVRVFNIGEQHSRFSTHNGKTFRSYTNKMTVIFQSGKYSQAKGFEASVRYVKMSVGHKVKKMRLKQDAEPTVFDYSAQPSTGNPTLATTTGKRKERQSGAVRKRKRIEILSEVLKASSDSKENIPEILNLEPHVNTCMSDSDEELGESESCQTEMRTKYNASSQTRIVLNRSVGCQTNFEVMDTNKVTVGTQTHSNTHNSDSQHSSTSVSLDTSFDCVETDPEWMPISSEITVLDADVDQPDIPPNKERKFLVFEKQLDELLMTECVNCGERKSVTKQIVGTAVIAIMNCKCNTPTKWYSQPMSGTMPMGNLIVAGSILFSGASIKTTLNIFMHAGIQCFTDRTYSTIQSAYLLPSVRDTWKIEQSILVDEIKSDMDNRVEVGGDARCCSPGHTAKYASYSLMRLDNNKVLDVQLIQSNEVANSYAMEVEGLKRCFAYLEEEDVVMSTLVTDRHSQIKKYMADHHPEVEHKFDVWHVAKGVFKKLEAAGKKRGCDILKRWARSISNHMYWCAASSNGDGELMQQKWVSILNHVTNIHEGHGDKYFRCQHAENVEREWIRIGCKAFFELEKIVKGRLLIKDIMKLSDGYQTSSLESFHRVNCFYAPKSLHFFHAPMEGRLFISALHFNENSSRLQAVTKEGDEQYRISYPKGRKGEGVAKEVKTMQTYGYIDELFYHIFMRRELYTSYSEANAANDQHDKQRPGPISQSTPRRPKQEVVECHKSRFNRH